MAEPDSGVGHRRTGRKIAGIVAILLFFAFFVFILTLPDLVSTGAGTEVQTGVRTGVRTAKPSPEVGELFVPDDGLERMSFQSERQLRANVETGVVVESDTLCVQASPELLAQIEAAAKAVPPGPYNGRALWAELVGERRLGPSPCRQRDAGKGVVALGPLLRIVSITRIRPLGCDPLVFRVNRLRCPEPPKPVAPVVLDDSEGLLYPQAALRARKQGRSTVRLLADSQDKLLSCDVVESAGDASLDSATCDLFRKRPQLIPKQGRTEGYATGVREVTQSITWRLPGGAPAR